jgi:hypothetical protein
MDIGFISCVSKKRNGTHKAKDLYISDLFIKSYNYCLKNYDEVYILSAKYGLLLPDTKIKNYNMTLNKFTIKEKKIWSYKTYNQIISKIKIDDVIHWHCGINYRKYLSIVLKNKQKTPLLGLGIGKQLKWYKNNL